MAGAICQLTPNRSWHQPQASASGTSDSRPYSSSTSSWLSQGTGNEVADPNALALVPATTVDERIRVLTVGGVDPLLDPAVYPLQVDAPEPVEPMLWDGEVKAAEPVA